MKILKTEQDHYERITKFINDNKIPRKDILNIVYSGGYFVLFYYVSKEDED